MKDAIETLQKREILLQEMIDAKVGETISPDFIVEVKTRVSEVRAALNLITSNVCVSGWIKLEDKAPEIKQLIKARKWAYGNKYREFDGRVVLSKQGKLKCEGKSFHEWKPI